MFAQCFTHASVEADVTPTARGKQENLALPENPTSASSVPAGRACQDDAARLQSLPQQVTEVEAQAVKYIAGYVAFKLKISYPRLGSPTGFLKPNCKSDRLEFISRGGLRSHSQEWLCARKRLKEYFRKINHNGIRKSQTMTKLLQQAPRSVVSLLQLFAST